MGQGLREGGAGTGLSRAMGNGKWETECQQFMKWTPHAFPPTLTSIFPCALCSFSLVFLAFPAHWGHNQTVIGAGNDFAN